jgi:hypothetical protein
MASIDNTIETPMIAAEFVTDPAAPASGPGAGDNEGLRSWAEAIEAANMATKKKEKNFIVVADDAIAKLWNIGILKLKMKTMEICEFDSEVKLCKLCMLNGWYENL